MSNKYCSIRLRRGTASEWIASLPQPDGEVLKLGEPGYEKDTGKLKIGDGVNGWNNLAYLQAENNEDVILSQEDVDDAVANLLVSGSGIVLSYDDDGNSLTISTSGLQPSGNYSVVGHIHSSSDITNFNSSVSGLLPTISNSGDNRILTSTGSSVGINAESNATFDGTTLAVSGALIVDTIKIDNYIISSTRTFPNNIIAIDADAFFIETAGGSGAGAPRGSGEVTIFGINNPTLNITNEDPTNDYAPEIRLSQGGDTKLNFKSVDKLNQNNFTNSLNVIESNYPLSIFEQSGPNGFINISSEEGYIQLGNYNNVYVGNISGEIYTNPRKLNVNGNARIGADIDYTVIIGSDIFGSDLGIFDGDESNWIAAKTVAGSFRYGGNYESPAIVISSGLNVGIKTDNPNYTLDVNGSGNFYSGLYVNNIPVSVSGHTHTASAITDFNSIVSGLLPVKDIIAGSNVNVSSSSGIYTISSSSIATESASLTTTVFNKTGSPIPKFSVIYISGGQGDMPTISLASASTEMTSSKTYGVTAEAIDNMTTGKVIVFGALTGVNTDQFNPTSPTGDVNGVTLYLSPTTPGGLTTTKPSAPEHMVAVGTIVRTHQNQGVVEVKIQNGFELEELHNVAISGVVDGQFLQYNTDSELWIPSSSGNFSTLLVNGTGVSVSGHTHTTSQITDFSTSVSGLLPTIANSGDNRLLTSDGTSTGINAESDLTFEIVDVGTVLNITHTETESTSASSSFLRVRTYTNNSGGAPRIQLDKIRGTEVSQLPVESNEILGVIRWFVPNSSGVLSNSARILVNSQGVASGENNFVPTQMVFNTSSGPDSNNNRLEINSDGSIDTNCSLTVDNGLSAPTPIFSLGSVSGNVSINYGIDKQIQTLTLTGANTNFIEGSGWDIPNKSVDVFLEITVTDITQVIWTLVDDRYNPFPTFGTGKYLVLLRSMGSTIQSHYIGNKTN
jgi:hypothetical protein